MLARLHVLVCFVLFASLARCWCLPVPLRSNTCRRLLFGGGQGGGCVWVCVPLMPLANAHCRRPALGAEGAAGLAGAAPGRQVCGHQAQVSCAGPKRVQQCGRMLGLPPLPVAALVPPVVPAGCCTILLTLLVCRPFAAAHSLTWRGNCGSWAARAPPPPACTRRKRCSTTWCWRSPGRASIHPNRLLLCGMQANV